MSKKRPTSWRCKDIQQQKDKATIYNSREWRVLSDEYKRQHPLCEMCIEEGQAKGIRRGYVTSAHCVHHKVPIETATTMAEMRQLAFDWNNLQSLCRRHHHMVHNDAGYHKPDVVKQRKESAFERWKAKQQRQQPPTDGDAPT